MAKQVPFLLVQEVFRVDAAQVFLVLDYVNIIGTTLAGQRDGQLLNVHWEIVKLEPL